jgi:antitoxin CptB
LNEEYKRLLWRSRRGMKELDLLLERFVRERYDAASDSQKCAFAQLLELPDPVMADYLLGHAIPPEATLRELTRLITAPRL